MSKISGIHVERKLRGRDFNLVINYKKHPQLVERILEEQGIENPVSPYAPKFAKKILSQRGSQAVTIDTKDLWK